MAKMSRLISCPECGFEETSVVDVWGHPIRNEAVRRRVCPECGCKFRTIEEVSTDGHGQPTTKPAGVLYEQNTA